MKLTLYNTLSRKKEIFKPIDSKEVRMYTCGPTVYWFQHIGNLRAYLFSDTLRRVLEFNKYAVKQVVNVTDVGHLTNDSDDGEDKMEKAATKEGKKASDIAQFYFDVFLQDLKKVHILSPWKWTKATEHIPEQIELIKTLEKKGFTYQTSDGIYFDSSKFKEYGQMARLNVKELKAGKRISLGEKKHKTDFALWKFSEAGAQRQQEWKSPWGVGFPGWHIECSAMSMKYLGNHFDIHTGGEDHIPIHHTNEIAQSEAATEKKFVNYWTHVAFLVNNVGEKVSKSKGGLFTLSELEEKGYDPLDLRYLYFMTHYRKQLRFSLENLDAAHTALKRLKAKVLELKKEKHAGKDLSEKYEKLFLEAVNDDLNMPRALQVVWDMLNDFTFSPKQKIKLLERFDGILGFGVADFSEEKVEVPREVLDLLKEREKLRKAKLWAEADLFRQRIREKGFEVEDGAEGAKVKKI